ncbi:YiiX/YebB-like N1pC/P60 family cysteine hydrolase, partial [Calditrichota bacterium]
NDFYAHNEGRTQIAFLYVSTYYNSLMKSKLLNWSLGSIVSISIVYAALLVPETGQSVDSTGGKEPFAWNMDEYWSNLESKFVIAQSQSDSTLSSQINRRFHKMDSLQIRLHSEGSSPDSPIYASIESEFFELAALLSANPERLSEFSGKYNHIRSTVKEQSINWDMNSKVSRDCLYRLLYGGRTAIEEVIMQSSSKHQPEIIVKPIIPDQTPSKFIFGVEIHSGDLLISRGGAPTSALIARGNDYPGNFSHAAIVYVDEDSGEVSVIEALIEKGMIVTSIDDYLKDKKLRLMILRLRPDIEVLHDDPLIPHKAAQYVFQQANSAHYPYDFAMNTQDNSKVFCSEVVMEAYRHLNIELWSALSNISRVGVRSWLSAFGVENFTTQEPSDLEYDPQLYVVAEWRDYETLYKDRLDNAVVDVMLEGADQGDIIRYNFFLLPIARIVKGCSIIMNQLNRLGPIPEGMSATAALKNKWFSKKHQLQVKKLAILTKEFELENGYVPPYWEIIKLSRDAAVGS